MSNIGYELVNTLTIVSLWAALWYIMKIYYKLNKNIRLFLIETLSIQQDILDKIKEGNHASTTRDV